MLPTISVRRRSTGEWVPLDTLPLEVQEEIKTKLAKVWEEATKKQIKIYLDRQQERRIDL